ncbi:hypothetical protein Tco_0354695, partial [Tanacetum coccineum]
MRRGSNTMDQMVAKGGGCGGGEKHN